MSEPILPAIETLGANISTARRRRRLTMAQAARRAGISRGTWSRLERGGAEVSIGMLARALAALGLLEVLASMAGPEIDRAGTAMETGRLPMRVRRRRGGR